MGKYFLTCAVLFLVFLQVSCNSLVRRPSFKLAIHQVVPDAVRDNAGSSLIVRVRSIDGREERMVRSFPMIDSRHILKIDVLRQPDGRRAALKIYFDNFAPGIWSEVHAYHPRTEAAFVVDGFLSGFMELPQELGEGATLVTKPLWSLAEARLIAENATKNYVIINKR